jgi:Uma2 family endonuclease
MFLFFKKKSHFICLFKKNAYFCQKIIQSMATTALLEQPTTKVSLIPNQDMRLTVAEFLAEYSTRKDAFKYELVNGKVQKTLRTMNREQYYIVRNLLRRFAQTEAYKNGAELAVETDMETISEQIRRPDISFCTEEQILAGDYSLSEFAIEIISPTDNFNRVFDKVDEYFKAGMKVLWHILPHQNAVQVFYSPRLITVFIGDEVVSAAPVAPDFTMTVNEIFKKQRMTTEK